MTLPVDDPRDEAVYHLFVARVPKLDAFRAHMERAGIEVVNLIVESRQRSDIIEFTEPPQVSENRAP